jgi:serine/threonine protein phosphatase 1
MSRLLAIGDIHGCSTALESLLTSVGIQDDDTIVTLGDYVDRGPDSRGVIDSLLSLQNRCRLIALRGNHDQMMLAARSDAQVRSEWLQVGGRATIASYGTLDTVPAAHWDFLERQCVDVWETDTHFFVHGNAYPDVPILEQPRHVLYWERFDRVQPHASGKIMICGHTSQKGGLPNNQGFAVCIDTWAHAGMWLTCMDVETNWIWQADIDGETRQFPLAGP